MPLENVTSSEWRLVARKGTPWAMIPLILWLTQVWAIYGSGFSMEFTLLQFPFIVVFILVIYVIAYDRVRNG